MAQQIQNMGSNGVSIPVVDAQARADLGTETLPDPSKTVKGNINALSNSLTQLENKSYFVTQWVTFTYYTADQLVGEYTNPAPTGWAYRLFSGSNIFANNALGTKFSGKYLDAGSNKIRALGSGFASGDTATILVLFQIYKV